MMHFVVSVFFGVISDGIAVMILTQRTLASRNEKLFVIMTPSFIIILPRDQEFLGLIDLSG